MKNKEEIGFLESFSADTSIVPIVINNLIDDLKEIGCSQDDLDEIVLSMDESVTNAVQETIDKHHTSSRSNGRRDITIRYTITKKDFDATIIDHGKGLDIFNILNSVPDKSSEDYHQNIISYATESEKNKIKVRVNGKEIQLKGIGAGLKIILNFMDSVTIDFIDKEKILTNAVTKNTDGTIFNMKRHFKKVN